MMIIPWTYTGSPVKRQSSIVWSMRDRYDLPRTSVSAPDDAKAEGAANDARRNTQGLGVPGRHNNFWIDGRTVSHQTVNLKSPRWVLVRVQVGPPVPTGARRLTLEVPDEYRRNQADRNARWYA